MMTPVSCSPGAGGAGTAGWRSPRSHAYWPEDETSTLRRPLAGTVVASTIRQTAAVSSQRARTRGVAGASVKRAGTLSRAGTSRTTWCGATSAPASGDHPGGSSPCNPCWPIGASEIVWSLFSAPPGRISAAFVAPPLLTVPPSSAETACGCPNGVSRASIGSTDRLPITSTWRSTLLQPDLVMRRRPVPSVARSVYRPRRSDSAVCA